MNNVRRPASTRQIRLHRTVAAAVGLILTAAAAAGHWVQPEDVVARLQSPEMKARFDIVSVAPNPQLPRLILIRVGPKWHEVPEERRIEAAERWQHLWRDSTPAGIIAILDAATDDSLVNFDGEGNATLKARGRRTGEDDRPAQ